MRSMDSVSHVSMSNVDRTKAVHRRYLMLNSMLLAANHQLARLYTAVPRGRALRGVYSNGAATVHKRHCS